MNNADLLGVSKWRALILITLFILTSAALSDCSSSDESIGRSFSVGSGENTSLDQSFSAGTGPRVEIDNINGPVNIMPTSDGMVRFEAKITRADQLEYDLRQEGNTVIFESHTVPDFTSGDTPEVVIDLWVPVDTTLMINSGNGRIDVSGMRNAGQLNTGNGEMTIANTQGKFTGNTGNGKLSLTNVTGEFNLNTGNGGIKITFGRGEFDLNSGNGEIELDDVEGSVSASTGNGRIDFFGALTPLSSNRISTGNGRVEVKFTETPEATIDAETKRGQIRNDLIFDRIELNQPRHLIGVIGAGGSDLEIDTGDGEIILK